MADEIQNAPGAEPTVSAGSGAPDGQPPRDGRGPRGGRGRGPGGDNRKPVAVAVTAIAVVATIAATMARTAAKS